MTGNFGHLSWGCRSRGAEMAGHRITLTLSKDVIRGIKKLAGPRGVSAWLDAVARERLAAEHYREKLIESLDELEAQDPSTPEERAAADEWFRAQIDRGRSK